MKQRDYINGLRAVAILPVVVYHAWPGILPGGYIGVSVFFVISGFLITYLIADEVTRGVFSISGFYARRMRRLLPAAVTVFVATFLVCVMVLAPDAFRGFGRSLVAADLLHANVYFAKTAGYFDAPSHEKPLLHFWSLSIEEQYYLLWPLLIAGLMPRIDRRVGLALLVCLLLASLVSAETLARTHADKAFYAFAARAWELMTGAVLAVTIHRLRPGRWLAEALGVGGLAAILASCIWLDSSITFPGLAAVPACFGTAAVLASAFHRSTWSSRALSGRGMVYVGLISYSLYLWHWPILSLSRYYLERPLLLRETVFLVAMGFAVAALSWHWIEQPFRQVDGRFRRGTWTTLRVGGVSMVLVAILGGVAQADRGWLWRFGPQARQIFEQRLAVNPWESRCDNNRNIFANDGFCNFGRTLSEGETFEVAVFGDSNADHFVPLVADHARREGLSGRQVTQTACGGLLGVRLRGRTPAKHAECLTYQRNMIGFVERNPDLKLVIISGNWVSYQGRLAQSGLVLPELSEETSGMDPVPPETLEFHLRRTIRFLWRRGIKVHLISQIPYQNGLPIRCVLEALRAGDDARHCGVSAPEARASLAKTNELFERLAAELDGVSATIPTDLMCDDTACPILMDDVLLYRDEAHLNADGATHLGRYIALPGVWD